MENKGRLNHILHKPVAAAIIVIRL